MPDWLEASLPAAVAFVGVLLAIRASGRRDAATRLWDRRASTYLDVIAWVDSTVDVLWEDVDNERERAPEEFKALAMSDDLVAKIWAFASEEVVDVYGRCRGHIDMLSDADFLEPTEDDRYDPYWVQTHELRYAAGEMRRIIRDELKEGTLHISRWTRLRRRMRQRWYRTRFSRWLLTRRRNKCAKAEASLAANRPVGTDGIKAAYASLRDRATPEP